MLRLVKRQMLNACQHRYVQMIDCVASVVAACAPTVGGGAMMFPPRKRRAEALLPCEAHEALKAWCEHRGSNDVWAAVQVLKANVTSQSAPSAPAR